MEEQRKKRITNVVRNRQSGLTVVIEDIHDPHNGEAIIRTCEGLGIQSVHFIFEKEKPFNPRKIGKSSSSSANKWLDFYVYSSSSKCLNQLKKDGYLLVATTLTEVAESIITTQFAARKLAILVGNEHKGLSETALKLADKQVKIPMSGMVQSLNVSVATGIILYEVVRQRFSKGEKFHLTQNEQYKLYADFIKR